MLEKLFQHSGYLDQWHHQLRGIELGAYTLTVCLIVDRPNY